MTRCSFCSAPLPEQSINCIYCNKTNDFDLKSLPKSADIILQEVRNCPQCDTSMKSIDLFSDGRFLIERCASCLGMFFDTHELTDFLNLYPQKAHEYSHKDESYLGKDLMHEQRPALTEVKYVKCPVCMNLMHRVNLLNKSGIIIDRCYSHGIWLAVGKLQRLLEWHKGTGQDLKQKNIFDSGTNFKNMGEMDTVTRNSSGHHYAVKLATENFSEDLSWIDIFNFVLRLFKYK